MKLPAPLLANWLLRKMSERHPVPRLSPPFPLALAVNAISFLATWGVLAAGWMLVGSDHSLAFIAASTIGGSLLYGTMMAVARPKP